MKSSFENTIAYYDDHAEEFFERTVELDMGGLYRPFLEMLPQKASILDAACGSGRDSLHFMRMGHSVVAFDASARMVALSSKLLGTEVLQLDFESMEFSDQFDGIWACGALLHVPANRLGLVISKMEAALVEGGVICASFIYGKGEGTGSSGRFFSYHTEQSLTGAMRGSPRLSIVNMWKTSDVRPDREDVSWLNILARKAERRF